jgi:hypothetical protein
MYSTRMRYVEEQLIDPITSERYTHYCLRRVTVYNEISDDSLRGPTPQRRRMGPALVLQNEVEVVSVAPTDVVDDENPTDPPRPLEVSIPPSVVLPTTPRRLFPQDDAATAPPVEFMSPGCELILHNQFSTPQRVQLYHRIMSEKFSIGQEVHVRYGTGQSSRWVPATVINIDVDADTYGVHFHDTKLGNSDKPTIEPPEALRRAPPNLIFQYDDEDGSAGVEEALSLCGWDDDDEEWNQHPGCRRKDSRIFPSNQEMQEIILATGMLTVFPPRKCWYHSFMPFLRLDTDVVKKVGSAIFVGTIRQITQDPARKECFRYYIRSRPKLPPFYEEVGEDTFIADVAKGLRWATNLPVPSRFNEITVPRTSRSSTHSDIYPELTLHQAKKKWPPHMSRMYDFRRGVQERKNIVHRFLQRRYDLEFIAEQRDILAAFWSVIRNYTSKLDTAIVPPRFGWALWVVASPGSPFHRFQIAALLLHTNNVGDLSVKQLVHELFKSSSSVTGNKFDNPLTFVEDPHGAFHFLTARAAAKVPRTGEDGMTAGEDGTTTLAVGIRKGVNYGNVKALSLIFLAKQLVVSKYCELLSRPFSMIQRQLGRTFTHGSLEPLPASITKAIPSDICLFPPIYDETFLNSLHGVGVKIRHLLAEAGYGVVKVRFHF